ncbi:MAG TPA: hypothetical protein VMG12_10685 [Polyangiaceae bacterium]|nr:hypothetical protein [Polyangiaceae bacterium]
MILRVTVPIPIRTETSSARAGRLATLLALAALALCGFPRRLAALQNDAAIGDTAIGDARVSRAEATFDEGRNLLRQGRVLEACPKLEESQRLDPGLGTQLNLADCYERAGRFASAHALFVEVAAGAHRHSQDQREQVARTRATALETRVSQLVISVPEGAGRGLHVERDGRELAPGEWNVLVPVDPGVHAVRAWGPGVGEWRTEVRVGDEGELHEVAVPFDDARPFLEPLHRKFGLAAAGVGVAGVLVGSIFGLRAIAKKADAERAGCDGRSCETAESGALRDDARSAGNVATLALGVGAASLAASAVLFWVVREPDLEGSDGSARSALLELSPRVFARGGGLWLRTGF